MRWLSTLRAGAGGDRAGARRVVNIEQRSGNQDTAERLQSNPPRDFPPGTLMILT